MLRCCTCYLSCHKSLCYWHQRSTNRLSYSTKAELIAAASATKLASSTSMLFWKNLVFGWMGLLSCTQTTLLWSTRINWLHVHHHVDIQFFAIQELHWCSLVSPYITFQLAAMYLMLAPSCLAGPFTPVISVELWDIINNTRFPSSSWLAYSAPTVLLPVCCICSFYSE